MNLIVIQENQYDLDLFYKFFSNIHFINPCYSNHIPDNIKNFDILVVDENLSIPNNYTKYIIVLTNDSVIESKNVFSLKKPIEWKKFTNLLKDIYEMNEWSIIHTQPIGQEIDVYEKKDIFMINYETTEKGLETCQKSLDILKQNIPFTILQNIQNILEEIAMYFQPFRKKITAYISQKKNNITLEIKNNLNFIPFFAKSTSDSMAIHPHSLEVNWFSNNNNNINQIEPIGLN